MVQIRGMTNLLNNKRKKNKTPMPHNNDLTVRNDWTQTEIEALFALPFAELMYRAQTVHRAFFPEAKVQISTLLSIKTGGCPEDCKYCPQSAHFKTPVDATKLLDTSVVVEQAKKAKEAGADRFCMGAAWRSPKDRDMPKVTEMVKEVKALGLETCMTLGMLDAEKSQELADAGLDYYNHNIDTSEDFYHEVISTRTYEDRLETLRNVRDSGMKVCCGGIVGMGETVEHRAGMIHTLATLAKHPDSVPINRLVQVEGTPLKGEQEVDDLDFVRTIAVARICMPASVVRLSAGREEMAEATQALCFMAGANSMFYGEELLTTPNPSEDQDMAMLAKLGLSPESHSCQNKAQATA